MFDKVLIANRGEIALRIARTCRELGILVVAAYSTEDRDSAVVQFADEAVQIGPGPARRSYLNIPALIEAAARTGADAVHPGYGFLAENPDFAEVCEAHGLVFVGPPSAVIEALGDKIVACGLMAAAGVPVLPGCLEPPTDRAGVTAAAAEVGYPLIIKAAAGGGGRGMQVVTRPEDMYGAYLAARSTAQTLFGDSRVYFERFLAAARHVEVQILADRHGNVVHLGERDCSVQRRHQKLVEEAPAPGLSAELSAELSKAAVDGARAVGYEGAGTFEFLVDELGEFYFLEVNCRIQVEHAVTEMVTGVDVVREQLRAAAGLPIEFAQQDVAPRGVALECRINAEDPRRDFMPTPGVLRRFVVAGGPFVRVDTYGFPGARVSPAYDSLLAKVIVWAPDREQGLARMRRALGEFEIDGHGMHTTIDFLREVIDHPNFRAAAHSTSFVDQLTGHS
jgi:acetyl-CoA carboxylase biotin carboxylase subunit